MDQITVFWGLERRRWSEYERLEILRPGPAWRRSRGGTTFRRR